MAKWVDKRAWPRLELQFNVEFNDAGEAEFASGTGSTENVSAGGIYFQTADWQELREGQNLDMRLSGLNSYGRGPFFRTLMGKVTILRLQLPDTPTDPYSRAGVAARFDGRPQVDVYRLSS
jgi:hypothetical protein